MQQYVEKSLSEKDMQLIEANRLGHFLRGYRVKPGVIRFLRVSRWFCITLGIVGLVAVIYGVWILQSHPYQDVTDTVLQFGFLLPPLGGSLLSLWMGLFLFRTLLSEVPSLRVIICEQGLLKIRMEKETHHAEALHWQDMEIITMSLPWREYLIFSREKGKYLTLNNSYPNLNELVALLKQ